MVLAAKSQEAVAMYSARFEMPVEIEVGIEAKPSEVVEENRLLVV